MYFVNFSTNRVVRPFGKMSSQQAAREELRKLYPYGLPTGGGGYVKNVSVMYNPYKKLPKQGRTYQGG